MITGCTFPPATNYNPAADTEDYSCIYLFKANGQCHLFKDVQPEDIIDKSFTLSFSVAGNGWVFYHDYIPDFYLHTRENLFNIKNNVHYKNNDGPPGVYHGSTPKSFFIDVIFPADTDVLIEHINWVTEVLNQRSTDQMFSTLTHITIWNSYQYTGRIELSQLWESLQYKNIRRTKGEWSMNDFRDILKENAGDFLSDIFSNYSLDQTKVEPFPTWYGQAPLQDRWHCIRFEYDNTVSNTIMLHDVTVQALKQNR